MTKTAEVVIGANYGDEGKGLFTDYLADRRQGQALVVRFNGGAQAGHTVTLPDGRRHVFSHFGSGSLAGAPTYLSPYFVCNPFLFRREEVLLNAINIVPEIYVDRLALVSTPYDMMINQLAEEMRDGARHGSCGVGFGETIERSEKSPFVLHAGDLENIDRLAATLRGIRDEWLFPRLAQLGMLEMPAGWRARLHDASIIDAYIDSARHFCRAVELTSSTILQARPLVFEGAQGLLLDQDYGTFPHVTRSNTGLKNVLPLARAAGVTDLDVVYVTRPYLTRHGAGPLPRELPCKPYPGIFDHTNVPNAFQGSLRYAWLDLDQLGDAIAADLAYAAGGTVRVNPLLGVSCLNQVGPRATYIHAGRMQVAAPDALVTAALVATGCTGAYVSRKPTREGIRQVLPALTKISQPA